MNWPRYGEAVLALWLIASAWALPEPGAAAYRPVLWAASVGIVLFDVLAIWGRVRYAYLLIPVVAAALIGFAWALLPAESLGAQNLITVSLLLGILGILPNEPAKPPPSWRGHWSGQ